MSFPFFLLRRWVEDARRLPDLTERAFLPFFLFPIYRFSSPHRHQTKRVVRVFCFVKAFEQRALHRLVTQLPCPFYQRLVTLHLEKYHRSCSDDEGGIN